MDKQTREFYLKVLGNKNVKRFYLAMEFNKINNPEFLDAKLYPLDLMDQMDRNPIYTPQINNISMHMPPTPVLYQWDQIPNVIRIYRFMDFSSF